MDQKKKSTQTKQNQQAEMIEAEIDLRIWERHFGVEHQPTPRGKLIRDADGYHFESHGIADEFLAKGYF